jgi:hypothetical protein
MLKLSASRLLHARAKRRLSEQPVRTLDCYLGDEQPVRSPRDKFGVPSLGAMEPTAVRIRSSDFTERHFAEAITWAA